MNETTSTTSESLVQAGRELFAKYGYDGTSVRSVTSRAGTNLGAITYHFGSKQALYEAVLASAVEPLRARVTSSAEGPGSPLDRVERVVRAIFDHLHHNPELPLLILQQLASSRPIPEVGARALRGNVTALAGLIEEGQKNHTIRSGDPRLMALSIGAQPIWLTMARRALQEGVAIDQDDPTTRMHLVESVVQFVRAGLASRPEAA